MGRHHRKSTTPAQSRLRCQRCHRPEVVCLCRHLSKRPPVDNRTGVYILQHPRERFHPKGTAPIAQLGLKNVHLEVAHFDGNREPARKLALPPLTGLLYPHEDSQLLTEVAPADRPKHVLLLDGTWGNARRLYRSNPWLRELPHFHLEPDAPGRYRIRGEPDPLTRSTIEAIVEALRILEPETRGLDQLLQTFDAMIDDQVAVIEREAAGSRRRQRWGEPHPVHKPLIERFEDVVVAYTESVACADGSRRPVHWVAMRPANGQTFERLLQSDGAAPNPNHLAHMELTPEDLVIGATDEELHRDWNEFLGTTSVVAAWNQSTLNLVATRTDNTHHPVLLKAAYCNLRRTTSGTLRAVLDREQMEPTETPFRGRAARRIGQAMAVLTLLMHPSAGTRHT